ncbi:MAG: ATP-binding protein [Bacteroidales bacterium]|nr:ATP-binding protein [Bacteroidales bacterium]
MNLPNIKIIELYGLPGCGKSTLTHSILSILQREYPGIVLRRSDISGKINKYWDRPLCLFLCLGLELLKPTNYKTKTFLLKYALSFPFNRYSIIYLLYTVMVIDLYRNNKTQIIVLDEGIIQFLSSIPHDNVIKKVELIERITKSINENPFDVLYVDCQLDLDSTMYRIKQRDKKDRFAYKDSLGELLMIKESNLALISNSIVRNKVIVDMKDSSINNAEIIINKIKQ